MSKYKLLHLKTHIMRQFIVFSSFSIALICFLTNIQVQSKSSSGKPFTYPSVKRIPKTFSYPSTNGNVTFEDDYFWMENANMTDKDFAKFYYDQNNVTEAYIHRCKDHKLVEGAVKRSSKFKDYENLRLWGETKGNPTYVYSFTESSSQNPIWYIASPSEFEAAKKKNLHPLPGRPFLNESLLSSDQSASISNYFLSPDATIFCYQIPEDGSELGTWYFRSTKSTLMTAKSTPDGGEGRFPAKIPRTSVFLTLQWFSDGSGFIYNQGADPEGGKNPDAGFTVRYHNWADKDDSKDITVFDAHDLGVDSSTTFLFFHLSDDDKWLIVSGYADIDNKCKTYATMLTGQTISKSMKWVSLAPEFEFIMYPVTIIDNWYYFQTDKDAPNSKVAKLKLDFSDAKVVKKYNELKGRPEIVDVIKERKDALIPAIGTLAFITAHDKVLIFYIEDGQYALYLYDLISGNQLERVLPHEAISFTDFSSLSQSTKSILSYSSYDTPLKIYQLDYVNGHIETSLVIAEYVDGVKPGEFQMEQLYATSKDGTQVPYFIISKKGTPKDGSKAAWLYAFAAYGEADNLYFVPQFLTWINEYAGYFVWCGARGGGDKGKEWYNGGKGVHKQNTVDDIIACAEDLVKRQFTSEGKIIIEGSAAGGVVTAAAVNQAKEGLFGVSLLAKAILDLFQFELRTSLGPNNLVEFGDVNKPEEVAAVLAYSPLQNIDPKKVYPATLVESGTDDDIVPESSSYKYLAQLQFTHPNSANPLMAYLQDGQGHYANGRLDEAIHQLCFIELAMGVKLATK